MSTHEQAVVIPETQTMDSPEQTVVNHVHETHEHNHIHEHDHGHENCSDQNAEQSKLTVKQRFYQFVINKSGIMQNQHVENITAVTCCGAVCRADLPVVAAYVASTAVAAVHKSKEVSESEPNQE